MKLPAPTGLPRLALLAPGTTRAALVVMAAVTAGLACVPWAPRSRWFLTGAVVFAALLLASWHGLHLTTLLRRRAALSWRNILGQGQAKGRAAQNPTDAQTTALVRVSPPGTEESTQHSLLPMDLIADQLDSYGLRCSSIRVTSQEVQSGETWIRSVWIGLTLSAVENLPALLARSHEVPLAQTARAAGRRLADQLRELGWEAKLTDEQPAPLVGAGHERWQSAEDERGSIAAYRICDVGNLAKTLEQLQAIPASEKWTVLEITGTRTRRSIAAGCALRLSPEERAQNELPAELALERGNQRPLLAALHPLATGRLVGAAPAADPKTFALLG